MSIDQKQSSAHRARFATTRWSVVAEAGRASSPEFDEALAILCSTYWYPLYAYVRRRGHSPDDSRDLTQEFFARLLEKQYLQSADRERGRFRSFLLTIFKRFLSKERDRQATQKRGGKITHLSIDFETGEERYRMEPSDDWTADKIFERRWALTLLDEVMVKLQREYMDKGKGELFEQCKFHLTQATGYGDAADELGMNEGAVRVAVHRMRARYRELLKDEVAQTLGNGEKVDDELVHLRAAIRGGV